MNRATCRFTAGFTFIELMTVMAIIAILTTISLTSYQKSITKARRTEATAGLSSTAQRLERCYTQFGSYNNGCAVAASASTSSGYYNITVVYCAVTPASAACTQPVTGAATSYFLTAKATGLQSNDISCTSFTLDDTGTKNATGTDAANCW